MASASDLEQRLRSVRRTSDGAFLGGVCAGIARAAGVDPLLVRLAFGVLTIGAGVGVPLYLLAWVFLAREEGDTGRLPRHRRAAAKEVAGIALLVLATLGVLRELGIWWSDAVVWPLVLTSAGLALIWRQSTTGPTVTGPEDVRPAGEVPMPTFGPLGELPRFGPRLIGGALLVVAGGVYVVRSASGIGAIGELLVATIVVLAGVTLIFGTSWIGLAKTLREERSARVRSEERAEMAAHLHDSVLQTLALIQRRGDEETAQLARRQERELRAWLDTGRAPGEHASTLVAALEAMAADVEADHRVAVEVVAVGDAPLDPRLEALVAAAREATVNAAKFAGTGRVDVFAEAADDRVEVFVRDRGPGFDRGAVDPARRGISESIEGRMRRHGGSAHVRTAPGEGTEVELAVAR